MPLRVLAFGTLLALIAAYYGWQAYSEPQSTAEQVRPSSTRKDARPTAPKPKSVQRPPDPSEVPKTEAPSATAAPKPIPEGPDPSTAPKTNVPSAAPPTPKPPPQGPDPAVPPRKDAPIAASPPSVPHPPLVPQRPSPSPQQVAAAARGRVVASKGNLKKIALALQSYFVAHQQYPTTLAELAPTYIQALPIEPCTNQPYVYVPVNIPPTNYILTTGRYPAGSLCRSVVTGVSYTPDMGMADSP